MPAQKRFLSNYQDDDNNDEDDENSPEQQQQQQQQHRRRKQSRRAMEEEQQQVEEEEEDEQEQTQDDDGDGDGDDREGKKQSSDDGYVSKHFICVPKIPNLCYMNECVFVLLRCIDFFLFFFLMFNDLIGLIFADSDGSGTDPEAFDE